MNNIILNSLLPKSFLQNKERKSVILKPLDELVTKQNTEINTSDSLFQRFKTITPKLINPLQLFHDESKLKSLKITPQNLNQFPESTLGQNNFSISQLNNVNTTIIEPGVSVENINALKQIPGKQWLGKLASNGNREAAIIIPEGADYNKPFEIIYYFHGHNGKINKSLTDGNYGFKDQIKNMAKDRNIIVVVPQGPPKSLDYTWMNGKNKEDMQQFENDTQNIIKTQLDPRVKISSVTVKGHSAGGLPIKNAATEGKLTADRIDFMDSSYGNWASAAYKSLIKVNPDAKFNVIYIPGSSTQSDALSLQGKKGVNLIKSNVGHSSVPKQFYSI